MKGYKLRSGMSYFARSFLFSFFSRCGRFISRKIFPFCLVFLILLSCLIVPSYAAEFTNLVNNPSLGSSSWNRILVTGVLPSFTYSATNGNKIDFANKGTGNIVQYYIDIPNIVPSDNYQFSFEWMGWGARIPFVAYVELYDIAGNYLNIQPGNFEASTNETDWRIVSTNFKPNDILTNGGTPAFIRLYFSFGNTVSMSDKLWVNVKNIKLIDTDEDVETGLLEGIKDWLSRVYHSIAGGVDSQGVNHTGIVQGISNAISNIQGWLNSVKEGIVNAISNISTWLSDLGDNIINGLKRLFIPADGFFDSAISDLQVWLTQHFGALYQGPQLGVDFLRKLFTIQPSNNLNLFVPNFEFDFMGEHYVLDGGSQVSFNFVNDSNHPLHAFYVFYKAFVTIILFFFFFTYIKNKYLQVFANGVGADDG